MLCNCSFAYSGLNILIHESLLLLQICRLYEARSAQRLQPNIAKHQQLWPIISALVLDKPSVIAVLHIRAHIYISTNLRFYGTCVDNTMRVIFHIDCHIQCASSSLSHVKSRPSQIQQICSFAYSSLNIQVKVSPFPL